MTFHSLCILTQEPWSVTFSFFPASCFVNLYIQRVSSINWHYNTWRMVSDIKLVFVFFMCYFVNLRIHYAQTVSSFSHFLLFGTLMQDEFSFFIYYFVNLLLYSACKLLGICLTLLHVCDIHFFPWLATWWTCAFIHVQLVSYISLLSIFYLVCKMLKTLFLFPTCYFVYLCIYILSW